MRDRLQEVGLKKFLWIIPIVIAFCVYSVAFNNFFVYDDFIWLYRAKTLTQNWRQMFYPDVIYFDPIVYLMFLADSFIGNLDPRWYHAVDLIIHSFNAFLVYRFSKMLTGDDKAGLYGSVLFASSFAIADAVLWPSSRVDLVSVMFSLGTLIQFLKYLRTDNMRFLLMSCFLFVLALGAKGTPVVMPVFLLWLIFQERKPLRKTVSLIPFGAVIILYIMLLKLTMHQAQLPLGRLHFNISNIVLAFCALFIPDGTLNRLDLIIIAPLLLVAVSALGLFAIPPTSTIMLRRTGYCILVAALLPVLVLTDFKLVTDHSNTYLLLVSPSHRLYLASVGAALLGGGILRSIETLLSKMSSKLATVLVVMLLAGVVTGNAFLVRERGNLWEYAGDRTRAGFEGLLAYRHQVGEGSQIGLINFVGSRGFTTPMFKLALDVNDITMLKEVIVGMNTDPEALRNAEKSFLFVLGNDGQVYDKSQLFRQQLLFNRMAMLNPVNPMYISSSQVISRMLAREIYNKLQ
jgi:hypothetical protein